MCNKPTPMQFSDYSQAHTIKSTYTFGRPELVWLKLQQNFRENHRTGQIQFGNGSINPHGLLNFGNRVQHVSRQLHRGWEILSLSSFKLMAKKTFFYNVQRPP